MSAKHRKTAKESTKDYSIGLDIGTNSVGWATSDEEFKVIRKSSKSLWGTRLFDEGQTAEARRLSRTQRRRGARKRERIALLQSLFADAIGAVDQGFFQRLKDSFFFAEDKAVHQPNTLFNDDQYKDKHYHKSYSTIYHLRHALMTSDKPVDIRLVYLAIHHIIKNRGHFLMKGESLSDVKDFNICWQNYARVVEDMYEGDSFSLSHVDSAQVAEMLTSEHSQNDKKKKLTQQFTHSSWGKSHSKRVEALVNLICGSPAKVLQLLSSEPDDEEALKKVTISFKKDDYDTKAPEWLTIMGDDFHLIEVAKSVYDWSVLFHILKHSESLSEAKMKSYEKHKTDLQLLKQVMKELGKSALMFGDPTAKKNKNYSSYVGYYKKGGKKHRCDSCSWDDFKNFIKTAIDKYDTPESQYILNSLKQDDFLPLQVTKDNSVIPNQVHLEELKAILSLAEKHYPFLKEKDEYGSVSEKIIKLMRFRIPFYVGPLNDAHKKEGNEGFCWIVRNDPSSKEKILPWNFDALVDKKGSAERFMERLSSKCSYLPTEDVLPKSSLLYQRFMVLNEINNLTIHGTRVSVELKQLIYKELFETTKKVTRAGLLKFLRTRSIIKRGEEGLVTGIDEEINANLSSLVTLKTIFGENLPDAKLLEEPILLITKLGMDADMLEERMNDLLKLPKKQIKQLCALQTAGWGRLSARLLSDIHAEGQPSIIQSMWDTQANLMQLLGAEHGYGKLVDEYNDSCTTNTQNDYQQVAELFLPPAVKRGVWQSIKIVKEVVKIMGGKVPKKIFIEVARGAEEKKRTISRRLRLINQFEYKGLLDWAKRLAVLTDGQLKSDRLYLYFSQMGKCMYTGKDIDINKLGVDYDVDHIQPISKTGDDSLDNRVLVLKTENGRKSDNYPIEANIRAAQETRWKSLEELGLISKRKLDRLVRNTALSDEELAGFINRQLVETRQSTKAVARLLESIYPETRVVYVKSRLVSRFRQNNDFIKIRELNDLHHAKDAYLSCVVGQVYDEKFTRDVFRFVKDREKYNLKEEKIFAFDLQRRGKIIWKAGEEGSMRQVSAMMARNDIMVTRMVQIETGEFFNQNASSKRDGLFPIKKSDNRLMRTDRYGGFDNTSGAYFFLVEHSQKKKRIRSMEFVPTLLLPLIEKNPDALCQYCVEQLSLKDPRIIVSRIPMKSTLRIDGLPLTLCGRGGNSLIFNHQLQFVLMDDLMIILKKAIQLNATINLKNGDTKDMDYLLKKNDLKVSDMVILYDCLLEKVKCSIYRLISPSPLEKLLAYRDDFMNPIVEINDDIEEIESKSNQLARQCSSLIKILYFFQCNAALAEVGGHKMTRIRYSKNITGKKEVIMIHQSITGFFESCINLLEL